MTTRIKDDKLNIYNPSNNLLIESISITNSKEIDNIIKSSKKASKTFNFSKIKYRKRLINKFKKLLIESIDEFVTIISNETGKKRFESLLEVFISIEHINNTSKQLDCLKSERRNAGILKTKRVWVEYEPIGVAGIISPWNYPLILTITPIVEALLAGNTVVLKPSEETPLTAKLLKKIWDVSTQQTDLFQIIYGISDAGKQLVESANSDIICFTGSTAVGKKIAETCTNLMKPLILELGGKDPMIVLEDANIKRVINAALWGSFSNAGQTCVSVEHLYVHNGIYKELLEKLKLEIKNLSSGINKDIIGAISSENNYKKVYSLIENAKSKNQVIQGTSDYGYFIPPTLVVEPSADLRIMNEEIFGPVLTITPFNSDNDVISLVNNSPYGLSASIFGKNSERIKKLSRSFNVGSITINDVMTHYGISNLPFGGRGLSGSGKVHGKEGLRSFSYQKSYLKNIINFNNEIWWFKKNKNIERILKFFIKWYY